MTTTFSHSIYHMISANISHDSCFLFLHAISGCTKNTDTFLTINPSGRAVFGVLGFRDIYVYESNL